MKEADLPEQVQQLIATLRMASDIGGEIAKVAAYTSIPITTYFMIRYLSAVSAPFPIGMSSSPTLVGVLATAFCIVFVSLSFAMAWIVWQAIPFRWARLRREAPHLRSHVIRFRFPRPVKIRRSRRRAFSSTRLRFLGFAYIVYLLVYLPFIALWILMAIGGVLDWHPSSRLLLVLTLGSLLVGTTVSFGLIAWLRPNEPVGSPAEPRWYRMAMFALLGLLESAITIVTVIFFLAITDVIGRSGSEKSFGLLVLLTILVIHMSANISRFEPVTTVSIWVFCSFMLISLPLGVSMYGALTLRVLGIGGSIGREVTLRTIDPTSGNPVIKKTLGCMLIKTGDEIAIHPTAHLDECKLAQLLHDSSTDDGWTVDVYPASQIIQISKVASPAFRIPSK